MRKLHIELSPIFVQLAITFTFCLFTSLSFSQNYSETLKAVASDREAYDRFGAAVDISGSYAIVGAEEEGLNQTGAAYIYEINQEGEWEEIQKLTASDGYWLEHFGNAVSISGNYAVVGAKYEDIDDSNGNTISNAGAAYIFKKGNDGNWNEIQKIVASDKSTDELFGTAICLTDDLLLVSAMTREEFNGNNFANVGAVYVFEPGADGMWTEQQKVRSYDEDSRFFGISVSYSEGQMMIGAPASSYDQGYAAIYEQDPSGTWIEKAILQVADQGNFDQYGRAVAIFEDYAVVGSRGHEIGQIGQDEMEGAGAAYIFKRDDVGNWNEVQKVVASNRDTTDAFGHSVSINKDLILIGAMQKDGAIVNGIGTHAGSAYLFQRDNSDNWNEIQIIEASDQYGHAEFGNAVAMSNHTAIVGANFETRNASGGDPKTNAGAAYFYSSCTPTIGFDSYVENDSLIWIDGVTYYSDNQTAAYSLTNSVGCDSIVFLDLIINNDIGEIFLETAEHLSSNPHSYENLGRSVAVSGNYAISGIISSTDENENNFIDRAGAVIVYERNALGNWEQFQKIVASDRSELSSFGHSLAMEDNYAVIGAPYTDVSDSAGGLLNGAGAVYIFKKSENGKWNEVQKLTASDKNGGDLFGISVSISGDYIVVGALFEGEDATGTNTLTSAGSAYVFKKDDLGTWTEVQKIVASDREETDRFGGSVAIHGDHIIVAAPFEDEDALGQNSFSDAGAVYIFERDATEVWNETQKVVASDRTPQIRFGDALAIKGDRFVVGAPNDLKDENGIDYLNWAGSAFIFERDATGIWTQVQKMVAPDRAEYDRFGRAVTISDEYIVIGTPFKDKDQSTIENAGATYVFKNNEVNVWEPVQKLVAEDLFSDKFGSSVAIYENYIIVGAPGNNGTVNGIPVNAIGKVNFFEICPSFIPTVVDTHTACNSFTWIDGNTYYGSNNTASFTAVNSIGCVTNVILDLTINVAPSYTTVAADTSLCYDGSMVNISGNGNNLIWYEDVALSTIASVGNTLNSGQNFPGTYTYFATDSTSGCPRQIVDTVVIRIHDLPNIALDDEAGFCISETLSLYAGDFESYLWNTTETSASVIVDTAGDYAVTVTDENACQNSKAISVSVNPLPMVDLGNDTTICVNENLMIDAGDFSDYLWNTTETSAATIINTAGNYSVTVTDENGCQNSDDINISLNPLPIVELGNDTSICATESIAINAGNFESYLWNTGETTATIVANETGSYQVQVRDANNCQNSDVLNLTINDLPEIDFGTITSFCVSDSLMINGGTFESYTWNTGAVTQSIIVNTPGDYQLTVMDSNGCQNTNSVMINANELPIVDLGNDTSLCAFNLLDAGSFSTYLWSTGATSQTIVVEESGSYTVIVTDDNNCQNMDQINLTVDTLDITIEQFDNTLTANQSSANYQWIDCSTNEALPDETNQSFAVNMDGAYAVIIDNGICMDTSACYTFISTSTVDHLYSSIEERITCYPNPTSGNLTLEFENTQEHTIIKLFSITNQMIQSWNISDTNIIDLEFEVAAGIYFMEVTDQNLQSRILKIVKQ